MLLSLLDIFVAGLFVLCAHLLDRILVAVILVRSVLLFTVIVLLIDAILVLSIFLAVMCPVLAALIPIFFFFLSVAFTMVRVFFIVVTFAVVHQLAAPGVITVELALLDHALEVLKDHFARQEAPYQRLHLDDCDERALVNLDVVLLVLVLVVVRLSVSRLRKGRPSDLIVLLVVLLFVWLDLHHVLLVSIVVFMSTALHHILAVLCAA